MSMTEQQRSRLRDYLKRLGYSANRQVRLYGANFDLTGDPIVIAEKLVLIDAVEQKSGQPRRIRIPLTILNLVGREVLAA